MNCAPAKRLRAWAGPLLRASQSSVYVTGENRRLITRATRRPELGLLTYAPRSCFIVLPTGDRCEQGAYCLEQLGQTPRILVVDDDPLLLRVVGQLLSVHGEVSFATRAEDALRLLGESTPDVILLDFEMPHMSGTELCRTIKRDPAWSSIPILFVTSNSDPSFEAACFELGASDYIHKPVRAPVLLARVGNQLRLKQMADELRRVARSDAVTGCANRRVFDEKLLEEWARTRRSGLPLSLALIDIDHFKLFNDHYGHPAGDACLRAFATIVQRGAARSSDLVARYGGEEFGVVLPDTDSVGARAVADHILALVHEAMIPHVASPVADRVSASVGISTFQPSAAFIARRTDPPPAALAAATKLLATADKALYEAKRTGRCRACFLPFESGAAAATADQHKASTRDLT